jgi:hypothetical protein
MVRPLTLADTADARNLLRARPLRNVFLDYVVSAGALGRAPGFFGFESGGRLMGILLIGPLGGTALGVDPAAHAPLADAAGERPAATPRRRRPGRDQLLVSTAPRACAALDAGSRCSRCAPKTWPDLRWLALGAGRPRAREEVRRHGEQPQQHRGLGETATPRERLFANVTTATRDAAGGGGAGRSFQRVGAAPRTQLGGVFGLLAAAGATRPAACGRCAHVSKTRMVTLY